MNTYSGKKEDYTKKIGRRLRTYRLQANLTQEHMAQLLDISPKHYNEAERGTEELSVNRFIFLSDFFGISLDQLLKGENSKEALPSASTGRCSLGFGEEQGSLLHMLETLNNSSDTDDFLKRLTEN